MKTPIFREGLRSHRLNSPQCIKQCSGISIFGRTIKTIIFSTDVAVIRNIDADAILAVYPFTPQLRIALSVIQAADAPVFCGVGGELTNGERSVKMAEDMESIGAFGVVVDSLIPIEDIPEIKKSVEIPVIATIISEKQDIQGRVEGGADFLNVSGAKRTPEIVRFIRERYPDIPIIATGGPTEETILATIAAGANAITYTPPSGGQVYSLEMAIDRAKYER